MVEKHSIRGFATNDSIDDFAPYDILQIFHGKHRKNNMLILKILSTNEPMTRWEISKNKLTNQSKSKVPPSYKEVRTEASVMFRRINELAKNGFIVKKGNKSSKGSSVPTYGLTFKGLIAILASDAVWDSIDEIVRKQRNLLPAYFDLWDAFDKLKVKDIAIMNLKHAVNIIKNGKPIFPFIVDNRAPTAKDFFLAYAVCLPDTASANDEKRWIKAAVSDKELYNMIMNVMKWFYESYSRSANIWEKQYDEWSKARK